MRVFLSIQGCDLLSDRAGLLRVHWKSFRFRLQRLGIRNFPEERLRFRPQPKLDVDTVCPEYRRPNAGDDSAQCGYDPAAVSDDRGTRAVLPEGVLSQRLHQEPETTRPLLQHARQI